MPVQLGFDEDELSSNERKVEINLRKEYAHRRDLQEDFGEIYKRVSQGYDRKTERDTANARYWDIYNCELGPEQGYAGRSEVFIPVVHDAIEARALRFSNIMFPQSGRYVEALSESGDVPYELMAMLNNYVETSKLRQLVPALSRAGDITGQYSVYVDWYTRKKKIIKREEKPVTIELNGEEVDLGTYPGITDVEEEEVYEQYPTVSLIADEDLCVLPETVDHIREAHTVAITIRATKQWIKDRIADKTFTKSNARALLDEMRGISRPLQKNPDKKRASAAGIRIEGDRKICVIWQVWTRMKIDGEETDVVIYFAGQDNIISCKRNPYWSSEPPVISVPRVKIGGTFWGVSAIKPVESLSYAVNDAVNMAIDSANYSLMPIVMTDPAKNPKIGSMVMSMAAVWETSPNDTQFVEMPQLWKDALALVSELKAMTEASLNTNPAMLPQNQPGRKPSQSQVAQEQAIAQMSTQDSVVVMENFVLSPIVEKFFEFDQQFRDEEILIPSFGELGRKAALIRIPPQQWNNRYYFRWYGSTFTQSVQQIQQKIAGMNILMKIPPQLLGPRKLDIAPIVEELVEIMFGPRLAPKIFRDVAHQKPVDPIMENQMMTMGFAVEVHPEDDDNMHLQAHMLDLQINPQGKEQKEIHIAAHKAQMMLKQQQAGGGAPGNAGAGGPGRGGPGGPRPGAQPGQGRPAQAPAGAIPQDQISDPSRMPRG